MEQQRYRLFVPAALTLAALAASVLAGCGGARSAGPPAGAEAPSRLAQEQSLPAPGGAPAPARPAAAPATPPAPAQPAVAADRPPAAGGKLAAGGAPAVGAVAADPGLGRKVILNADIALKVTDARQALNEIQDLANFNRGYLADASLTGSDEGGWNGRLVLRIPAANYGSVMTAIRKLGAVRQERQWSQDVTEQYMDLEARIKILTEHEQRLRELALKASSFDEWLKLTSQVNDTRIQIENLTGRLRLLSNQVEFSTINISLIQPPPERGKKEEAAPSALGERMAKAFRDSARALAELGAGLLVLLAGLLPVGAVLAALAAAAWILLRLLGRRSAGRPSPPPSPPTAPTLPTAGG